MGMGNITVGASTEMSQRWKEVQGVQNFTTKKGAIRPFILWRWSISFPWPPDTYSLANDQTNNFITWGGIFYHFLFPTIRQNLSKFSETFWKPFPNEKASCKQKQRRPSLLWGKLESSFTHLPMLISLLQQTCLLHPSLLFQSPAPTGTLQPSSNSRHNWLANSHSSVSQIKPHLRERNSHSKHEKHGLFLHNASLFWAWVGACHAFPLSCYAINHVGYLKVSSWSQEDLETL